MKTIDVEGKTFFPAETANKMLDFSKSRNDLLKIARVCACFGICILLMILMICGTVMDFQPYEGTTQIVCNTIAVGCVLAILIFIYMQVKKFDFRECSDAEYDEIASLKLQYPEVNDFVKAISETGRTFISKYENEAIISFQRKRRIQDSEKNEIEKLKAAKLKVFSLDSQPSQ